MPITNKLPAKAGTTKLISQMAEAVKTIPKLLELNTPNRNKLILPLTPNSANAMVGITANTRNMTVINQNAVTISIPTLNTGNNSKY